MPSQIGCNIPGHPQDYVHDCDTWWHNLEVGSSEWVAEVIRTGREGMRELLDALRDETPPEQQNTKGN